MIPDSTPVAPDPAPAPVPADAGVDGPAPESVEVGGNGVDRNPASAPIACVGDNCVDVALDRPGVERAGGNALNVAVELARAGHRVAYYGAVGDDPSAQVVVDALTAAGVDPAGVRRLPGATGRTVVSHLPGGERIFVSEDYGVAAGYRLDAATVARLAGAGWIHFARQPDLAAHGAGLRASGARLSCDFGDAADLTPLAPLLAPLDVAFLSQPDGDEHAAAALRDAALAHGARLVVVTLGAAGSLAGDGRRTWRAAAVPVADVVDTLGAGDAFIAAFVGAVHGGADVVRALDRGSVAGAAACTRVGLADPPPATEVPA